MPAGLPTDTATLRKYSTWFLVYGVVMMLLGVLAIAAPGLATLAVEITVGWLLLLGGVFGLLAVFSTGRDMPGFWWDLLVAIICVLAGLSLLLRPAAGAVTLTILFTAYLLAGGIARIALAFRYRSELPGAWGWMLASGLIDIVLAMVILSGMPGTAVWVLGVLAGINMLIMGFAIVMAAVAVRKAAAA
jgi:uncharacterized membrane protein HdeD (DUF308 family)